MKNTPEFQKLDEEISFYLNDKNSWRALVLHAAWGSGKTYLINEWLGYRRKNRPYTPGMVREDPMDIAYISAFGVRTADELHEKAVAAFIEMAPKKSFYLGGRVLLAAVTSGFNVNLPPISNTTLLKFIERPKAIIIDDVERSFGNLGRIYGAVNEFIEQHKVKVILICDRSKLEERNHYGEIEKIADTIIPFPATPKETSKKMIAETLMSVDEQYRLREEIEEAVEHSGTENVRTVAKALGTYRRLCKAMSENQPKNVEHLGKLAYAIVAYTIELYQGNLTPSAISEVGAFSFGSSEKSVIKSVMQKYIKFDVTSSFELPLNPDLINKIIVDNGYESRAIADEISSSRFFGYQEREEWEIVWHKLRVDREDVEKAIIDQQNKLDSMAYKDTGVLLHVFANKLQLSQSGIIPDSFESIESDAKTYIKNLASLDDAEFHLAAASNDIYRMNNESYKGLGYPRQTDDPAYAHFKSIETYLVEVFTERVEASLERGARNLFANIAMNFTDCHDAILAKYPDRYYSEFLHRLDESLIAEQICGLPNSKKYEFMLAIGSRLHMEIHNRPNETEWCKRLGSRVAEKARALHPLDRESAEKFAEYFLIGADRDSG